MQKLWLPILFLVGCAGRSAAWERNDAAKAAPTASNDQAATLDQQAQALWAERLDVAKAEAAVTAFANAASQAPSVDRLAMLARAHYFLADTHYALAERKDDMMSHYALGLEAGEQGVVLASPEFAKAMKEGAKVEEAVKLVPKEAVPSMYWYATNLGKWAKAQGLTKMLFYKDKIRTYMTHVLTLDANFFFGAPPRYFGAFYSVAPAFAGGDLKKSEESFNASLKIEPNYIGTKVLMAENLAPKKQDRPMFDRLIAEVLAADEKAIADIVPEQTFEKKKAEKLKAKAEELF